MAHRDSQVMYEIVMEDVINKVRRDFESAGYDESTLEQLKEVQEHRHNGSSALNCHVTDMETKTRREDPDCATIFIRPRWWAAWVRIC